MNFSLASGTVTNAKGSVQGRKIVINPEMKANMNQNEVSLGIVPP
jgi:hypothetical protein